MSDDVAQTRTRSRGPWRIITALLLGTALGGAGVALAVSAQPALIATAASGPLGLPHIADQSGFAPLVARVKPAVVQIATSGTNLGGESAQSQQQQTPDLPPGAFGDMLRRFFNQQNGLGSGQQVQPEEHALGSGFIIDPAGYIVTNNHVVDGAHQISVTMNDGNKYAAKVIGRDPKTDLALLKINAGSSLPYVAFGDSDKEQEGDWVIAVGNPYGLGGTVTAGIVSAHGRNIDAGAYDDFLQIDAPINPGNSGGPLFNQSGQVVGIDTAIYSPSGGSVGIGFAIPSNVAKTVIAQLREHGKVTRGWLGVQMQPLTAALAKAVGLSSDKGVLIDAVNANSPASRGGLQQGDVITAFDGKPVDTTRDLALAVAETPDGKTASISVWRNQQHRTLEVKIGSDSQEQVAQAQTANPAPVGMALEALTPDARNQLNLSPSVNGVVVTQVAPGSKADESGLQPGDVIERVAGARVSTPAEAANAIHSAQKEKKEAIPLLVMRDGTAAFIGLQLADG